MKFRPGPRLLRVLLLLVGVACFAPLWAPLPPLVLGALLFCLSLAALEVVQLRHVVVTLERPLVQALSLGEDETLTLRLQHDAAFPLRLRLRVRLPELLGGGSGWTQGVCGPGQTLALPLPVQALQRGSAPLEPPTLGLTRRGWVERVSAEGAQVELSVLPNLKAVRRLHHQLNQFFLHGAGTRLMPRLGQGREFDRLREYVPGDDFRHLAWKASARARKWIVREFRLERAQDVLLCVDRGHRMAGRVGTLTRNDHAINAAVLTAYLCNRVEDRVGMLSFAAEVERGVSQGRGGSHLAALTRFATHVAPDFVHTDYALWAAHLKRRLRSRTLVLLFTVLPEQGDEAPLLNALRTLMPRHLPAVVVMRDPGLEAAADVLPLSRAELSRTLVAGELVDGRRRLMREMRSLGALVAEAAPEDTGVVAVNTYLEVKRRQLL